MDSVIGNCTCRGPKWTCLNIFDITCLDSLRVFAFLFNLLISAKHLQGTSLRLFGLRCAKQLKTTVKSLIYEKFSHHSSRRTTPFSKLSHQPEVRRVTSETRQRRWCWDTGRGKMRAECSYDIQKLALTPLFLYIEGE